MQRLSVLERHLTAGSETGTSPWGKVPQVGHPSPRQHAKQQPACSSFHMDVDDHPWSLPLLATAGTPRPYLGRDRGMEGGQQP